MAIASAGASVFGAFLNVVQDTSAVSLANALISAGGTGISVTGVTLSGHSTGSASSSGRYTAGGTYGLNGSGIVLSTGNVSNYGSGPNTAGGTSTNFGPAATGAQGAILNTIGGAGSYFDVTELTITFDMLSGFDTVFFNVVFGSEEFPEYVGSNFIDGFGLLVNGTNVAFANGLPININHPNFSNIAGTELDGVIAPNGNPIMTFSQFVGDGSLNNTIKFIIADKSDRILDSTAYISALGGTNPIIPEPSSCLLWGIGLAAASLNRFGRRIQA